jgi:hypothetical protein
MGQRITGRYMPLLHEFIPNGAWTIQMRPALSHKHPEVSLIPDFYGISPIDMGCTDESGCGDLPAIAWGAQNFIEILEESFGYEVNIFSEKPSLLSIILGDTYPITKFSSKKCNFYEDLHYSTQGNRIILFHWHNIDRSGEANAFGGANYDLQVSTLDYQIYMLTLALWPYSGNHTTFFLMGDQGGDGFGHDRFNIRSVQTPFVLWGYNVQKGVDFYDQPTSTVQMPITMFDVLYPTESIGVVPSYWNVNPITGIRNENDYAIWADYESANIPDEPICSIPNAISHKTISHVVFSLAFINFIFIAIIGILDVKLFG